MNKRQYKKAFKQKYGYNPVNKEKTAKKAVKEISEAMRKLSKMIPHAIRTVVEEIQTMIKEIQTMPEEEFLKKLDELSLEQRNMAWKIRKSGEHK